MNGQEQINSGQAVLTIDYLPAVNYSMLSSGVATCYKFVVENVSGRDWEQVQVSLTGEYISDYAWRAELLPAGQSVQLQDVAIAPDLRRLSEITEAVNTTFTVTVGDCRGLLLEKSLPIVLMAYDQWAGTGVMPENIATFVVPNHPLLSRVKVSAARFLEQWTGSSELDEYQTHDRNRVRAQVAAIYEALRAEGIVYSAPPASFEASGQRLRLADKVLTEKVGTCIDTSLLVASCLEACEIYPILVFTKGHAMVGAWLTPTVSPQMVGDDVSLLLKETADGNNNLVVLESTAVTSSASVDFEEAVRQATAKLRDERDFLYYVDVHRCRLGNIRPMPQRLMRDGQWTFENEGLDRSHATRGVSALSHYDLRLETGGQTVTRQMLWERKLLDFSLRNNLLNTRLGKRVVPFISFEIEYLEDHLQNSEDYSITPSPGAKIEPNADGMYDSEHQAGGLRSFVSEMIGSHKIASYQTETELQTSLKYIYRTARTALEENGANSLFLALGMLRWFETAKSQQPRYAPILLLPVNMVRKSGNNYVIRKRDESIMLNITLVELLKQEFKINLDILQELPKDESGVDVKKVFTIFRRAILEQRRWNVVEESMLGLFSFNKFVMWNDIHSNADLLARNPLVATLIEGQGAAAASGPAASSGAVSSGAASSEDASPVDAREIDKENSPKDFAIPLDVDSSQMEAIVESGRGHTFILHGPPGTGKSQTITNMIANALYQGRRVLFVAEKMAALSVVQARLEKIGLAPFCLELHSNKATKKHFLEQMEQVLGTAKSAAPAEFLTMADKLFAERKRLISYMDALHRKGASGLSLYECISAYLAITHDETDAPLPPLGVLTADHIACCRSQVEPVSAILSIVGVPQRHPLYGLEPKDNRLETAAAIKDTLQQFTQTLARRNDTLQELNGRMGIGLSTADDLSWLEMFASHIASEQQLEQQRRQLTATYSDDVLRMNVDATRRQWQEVMGKWLLPRYFAKKQFLGSLQRYGQVFEADVDSLLSRVAACQQLEQQAGEQAARLKDLAYTKGFSHEQRLQAYETAFGCHGDAGRNDFMQQANRVGDLHRQLQQQTARLATLTAPPSPFTPDTVAAIADRWLGACEQMKDWCLWTEKKREMMAQQMAPVVAAVEQGVAPADAVEAYVKAVYHRLIDQAIDGDDQLRTFNGQLFRQRIEQYRNDTLRFQQLSKEELFCRLAARVPSFTASGAPTAAAASAEATETAYLKRNIANGGRGNSIRTIIDHIPTLLPRLCPCMLMSPISVAQYIDLKGEKFDLVIFDEASQMPTSEAVGAIARGKALIVVGDSKQMPPTSFFATTQVDEEEASIDDMESILDDCRTLSLREYYLSWHYRSKHESLIAFSNSQYYDNRLLTFPSVDDQQAKVRLVPVEGVYDKGRTRSNAEESKAIVAEVMRRLADAELSKYSIGVVAFSKVQGDRIEDDLTAELDRHPELKDVAYNAQEPIFVKNLENVQGDERDVILFSVGYGADKSGRVSMNFGPLNNAGGERRLNVAVSRARYEMIVYSSLKSQQIDLKRSHAKGVEGLKGFLEFAETGRLPMMGMQQRHDGLNVMVSQICAMLTAHGYVAKPNVGRSNFKVDVAVATKEHPEQYVMGILCDGRSYYETKTTRDREIVQPGIMRMLGWQVMRVYSVDWYENRERSAQQILEALVMGDR